MPAACPSFTQSLHIQLSFQSHSVSSHSCPSILTQSLHTVVLPVSLSLFTQLSSNSKHWFTTSFLSSTFRKRVPESDAPSVSCPTSLTFSLFAHNCPYGLTLSFFTHTCTSGQSYSQSLHTQLFFQSHSVSSHTAALFSVSSSHTQLSFQSHSVSSHTAASL